MKKIILLLGFTGLVLSAQAKTPTFGEFTTNRAQTNTAKTASIDNSRSIALLQERLIARDVAEAASLHPNCTKAYVNAVNDIFNNWEDVGSDQEGKQKEAAYEKALKAAQECTRRELNPPAPKPEPKPEPKPMIVRIPATVVAEIEKPISGYLVGSTNLTEEFQRELDAKIRLIQQYPDAEYKLIIEGHTCDIGAEKINENIAIKRAEAAKNYLIAKGIGAAKITVDGSKGESEPLVPNKDENSRKQNRRIVIIVK